MDPWWIFAFLVILLAIIASFRDTIFPPQKQCHGSCLHVGVDKQLEKVLIKSNPVLELKKKLLLIQSSNPDPLNYWAVNCYLGQFTR
jgi:hypothetical protein